MDRQRAEQKGPKGGLPSLAETWRLQMGHGVDALMAVF